MMLRVNIERLLRLSMASDLGKNELAQPPKRHELANRSVLLQKVSRLPCSRSGARRTAGGSPAVRRVVKTDVFSPSFSLYFLNFPQTM